MKLISIILISLLGFTTLICNKKKVYLDDVYPSCDTSWQTSEVLFDEDDKLIFRLRFVYFADSINEPQPDYDSITKYINEFYQDALLQFDLEKVELVVDSDIKSDMPSHVKYNNKFRNDSVITCYIYGNAQENFPSGYKNTVGSSGGIGSNFFSVRSGFVNSITTVHELGHCLSLLHVDHPDDSGLPYSTFGGDKICDTRSIKNLHEKVSNTCIFQGLDSLTEEEKKVLVCNFMSWAFQKCRGCITDVQIRKMRFYIHESPFIQQSCKKGIKHEF